MTAADAYAARIDAVRAHEARIFGEPPPDRWGGPTAQRFRFDPHRQLSPNLNIITSYVQPEDVVIDVGGGAGRVGLPLALRCREVINVDLSPGMLEEFEASAAEAGITNARGVQADWMEADGIQGDVTVVANVTYFVRDIRPFIEKLEAASRHRVLIDVSSMPGPGRTADFDRLLFGEEADAVPGHQELLAVLGEMGILPDVRVLPDRPGGVPSAQIREELIARLVQAVAPPWFRERRGPEFEAQARGLIEGHFDEYVIHTPEGYMLRRVQAAREIVITWETGGAR